MTEETDNQTIGRIVFDILDPFNENKWKTTADMEEAKRVIEARINHGKHELEILVKRFMKDLIRPKFVCEPASNMAESWKVILSNLPGTYQDEMMAEIEKARGKKIKSEKVKMYEFIQAYIAGQRKQREDSLSDKPLDMMIYYPKDRSRVCEPCFLMYRVKDMGKVIFKTARNIYEEERRIQKDSRRGKIHTWDYIKTMIRENSVVKDIFGIKCVVYRDMSPCDKIVEYLSTKYGLIENKDYYLTEHPKKKGYKARHVKINLPDGYPVEVQLVKMEDFLNNEFWELNHPGKDMNEFNRMSKTRRFKELYRRGMFLGELRG